MVLFWFCFASFNVASKHCIATPNNSDFFLLSCFLCFSFSVSLSHFLPIFINHSRSQEPGSKSQEPRARSQEPGQKAKAKSPKTLEIRHVLYNPSLFQLCTDIDLTFQWAMLFWQNFRLIIYLDSFPFPVILTKMKKPPNIYARAEVRRVKKLVKMLRVKFNYHICIRKKNGAPNGFKKF